MPKRMTRGEREAHEQMQQLLGAAEQTPPDAEGFTFGTYRLPPSAVVDILQPHMTDRRLARIDAVLAERTYTVATVVEGLANMGNVNAVMRTAEALGYQAFHIITGAAPFKSSVRTSQGADKWLDRWHWPSPADCAAYLKDQGYTLVATHLDDTAVPIGQIDFTRKTALVFGNELFGVSPALLAYADQRCILPMTGFVKSYNISVAAAIALYHAYQDRLTRQGYHGDLTGAQRAGLRARLCLRALQNSREIIEEVLARKT